MKVIISITQEMQAVRRANEMRNQMIKQDTTWENVAFVIGVWTAFVSLAAMYM